MRTTIRRLTKTILLAAALSAFPCIAAENSPSTPADPQPQLEQQVARQQERITELERLLRQQAASLEKLQQQLSALEGRTAPAAAPAPVAGSLEALAESNKALTERVNKLQKSSEASEKDLGTKIKGLGNFTFSGDLRVRYEPFFGGPANGSQQRQRERVRLRFNANAKFSDEFSGGLSLASGDLNDPISTNQTLTFLFTRKPIAIDKAFLTYNPKWFQPLSLTGGKFAYTWYHTELTWDNDLNPEGFSQTLSFKIKNPVLQKLVFVGFELPFNEVAGEGNADSFVYGGQLQTYWKLSDRVKFSGYGGFYNWHRPDAVANALNNSVIQGLFRLGGSGVQNSRTVAAPFQFASQFALLNVIGRLDVDTGQARWPLMVQLDFVNNTRPCANLRALAPSAALTASCNPRDRSGYWAEARLGRTQEQGDINFGYTFIRIEREAVLGAFNFSDLRQSSSVANHRLDFTYQAYKNIALGFTGLIGRPLASNENYLKRFQFDVLYKF